MAAEFFGTALLVCTVVGSGIMGTQLSDNLGVALLINALATVFVLALLIYMLAPLSGAHFNPAVSLVSAITKSQRPLDTLLYSLSQALGAIAGALTANFMFGFPVIQFSEKARVTAGTLTGEVIATAGLIAIIFTLVYRDKKELIPVAVAGWIGAAYFFTSSTSFANPAVTIGRVFSDSFSGISPESVVPFISAQLLGAIIGLVLSKTLSK
jgi:glycerol uptake facilitator-like aquaporin